VTFAVCSLAGWTAEVTTLSVRPEWVIVQDTIAVCSLCHRGDREWEAKTSAVSYARSSLCLIDHRTVSLTPRNKTT
jgi:hypothetical protein